MEDIRFEFGKTHLLSKTEIAKVGKKLAPEINRVGDALNKQYETEYASINLPKDGKLRNTIKKLVREKQALKPKILIVIGIGGSSLGTIAVHEALNGKLYNDTNPNTRVYFTDTVDADKLHTILSIAEYSLKKRQNVLVNVITKSGTTTETIANLELFVRLLKRYKKRNYHKYVIATTVVGSKLDTLAKAENFSTLYLPQTVGGRYSVFSAVGLFPLAMLGVNIADLHKGANSMVKECTSKNISRNPAALSSILSYLHNKKGRNINNMFLFSTYLESVGKWYRQLIGESIGKEWNKQGTRKVNQGITPIVSIGSTDLHSMSQLFLGGPQDKFDTIVAVDEVSHHLKLPSLSPYNNVVENIQGKHIHSLMDAILVGVLIAYKKDKRPFITVRIPKRSAYNIAQYLQFKMFEMMYLASLLNVNPFDQPAVEKYKKETRSVLRDG
jgi:glucose-6-phosphate isomerase